MEILMKNIAECFSPLIDCIDNDPIGCRLSRPVPSLPIAATEWQQRHRQRQLRARQDQYKYNYNYIPGLAMVDKVPLREVPGIDWFRLAFEQACKVLDNLEILFQEDSGGLSELRKSSETGSGLSEEERAKRLEQQRRFRSQLSVARNTFDLARKATPVQDPESQERGAPGTAVFSRHSNLLCRETLEADLCPTCGAVLHSLDEITGDVLALTAKLTNPCTSCVRYALERLWRLCVQCLVDVLMSLLDQNGLLERPEDGIEGYNRLFNEGGIPLPALGKPTPKGGYLFEDNRNFALRQIAGQNPMMLTLIRPGELEQFLERMPITEAQYQGVMTQDSLEKACEEKRLFFVSYGFAKNVAQGDKHPLFAGQKYIATPIALFALPPTARSKPKDKDARILEAVAIQCEQDPGPNNPVFTRSDDVKWSIAKTVFNNAAGNNSEFIQHLGYAHLLSEAFGIAMTRTLPKEHPINVLLTPHMEGTIFANDLAQNGMNQPPDMNLIAAEISATVEDTLEWTSEAVRSVNVSEWMLPKHFERQGTADPEVLPNYPYREDSLRIWYAIRDWVEGYLRIYYCSDEDVTQDYELRDWVRECETAGRLNGIGDLGRIRTTEQLIDTVTLVIYQASAHHALTNFPLSKIELYVPALPLGIYQPPPTDKKKVKKSEWLSYYAPLGISLIQQSLYFIIGTLHSTELGAYPKGWFVDERVEAPLNLFRGRLKEIEGEILRENANEELRPMPYIYLLPNRIPQSTNI